MSNDGGASSGSSSQSTTDSSHSSGGGQMSFFYDNLNDASNFDLTLYGSPALTKFVRTGTVVRRANSVPSRKDKPESCSSNEDEEASQAKEIQYRHSLASISERRSSRSSFSKLSARTITRTPFSSMETSSDPDYAIRSTSESNRDGSRTILSPTSTNYLSWIESVNMEYSESAISNLQDNQESESKVGEWNNFWLNYSNARLRHLSERTFSSNFHDVIGGDEISDEGLRSRETTPRDVSRTSSDRVMLTLDEVNETIRCSKRIADILENATKRSQNNSDSEGSFYSQAVSGKDSIKDDVNLPSSIHANRERSVSWVVDSHGQTTIQQPKQEWQKNQHSSSTSCINAILNTGNDILKKVIAKRREGVGNSSASSSPSRSSSIARNSFSDWGMK